MPIAPGTRLGQYEVQDFIGQGAMGVVYRAYHSQLERTGAVKVMQALTPDPDTAARFRHEAQAIARLRHPNIVDVYDFGEFQGSPYMIAEYVPGGSLAARMAQGPLDRAAVLRYLRGIAAGLDYAHGHGIVHRDVKPANVLLTADDSPVLADFGLARLLQGSSLKSMTGVTTGTPAYMAPEQVAGAHAGPAADRYSLATIAYEMLTGVIPFDGEGLMELLYAQVHRYPSPPSSRAAGLGAEVDAVIMRGLAKDPNQRWETCSAFVDALEAALATAPAPAPAPAETVMIAPPVARTKPIANGATSAVRAPATVVVAPPAPPETPVATVPIAPTAVATLPAGTSWPRRGRRRLMIGAAAAVILLLLMGVCAAVAQETTLTVNPTRAAPGQTVRVTATHVPANQAGEIQLHSVVQTYPFQADGQGRVAIDMTVPDDEPLGDHVVKICWDNTCHRDAALRVVSGVGEALPSPAGPSAGPSSSPGANATPRGTPKATPTSSRTSPAPGSTPRSTATPAASPRPTPSPSPTPTSNPCPGSSNAPSLTPSSQSVLLSGGTATVSGSNFTPNSTVTLSYYAPSGSSTAYNVWTVKAACNGTFPAQTFATKPTLLVRGDKVVACDVAKGCVTATINIVL